MLEQKIQNIFSLLGDAHTCCYSWYGDEHYLKTTQQRKEDEFTLIKVNDLSLQELLNEKRNLFSYETESWGIYCLVQKLSTLEGLSFLGLDVHNGITYTYENESGMTEDVVYYLNDFVTREQYLGLYPQLSKKEDSDESQSFVSFKIDSDRDVAILTLTKCTFNEEYRNCLRQMFQQIKEKDIHNVVVDLRDNGGGQIAVADEFIRYLNVDSYLVGTDVWRFGIFSIPQNDSLVKNDKYEEFTFNGKVYALTSTSTFSSAMLFANYLKDNHIGILIGETSGNVPTGYGEVAEFWLPQSRLHIQISTRAFQRADTETTDILVTPDIPCDAEDAMDVLYEQLKVE